MSEFKLKPVCFWCGRELTNVILKASEEEKKEIEKVLGENKDREGVFVDYNPCEHCMKHLKDNIMIIKVSENPEEPDHPPIVYSEEQDKNYYPTGDYMLIPDEIIQNTIEDSAQKQEMFELRATCMTEEDFNAFKNFLDKSLGLIKEINNICEEENNNGFVQ